MKKKILNENFFDELNKIASLIGINIKDKKNINKKIEKKEFSNNESKIVGSSWNSCKSFESQGGLNKWKDNLKINVTSNKFELLYKGPLSGIAIAHASSGKDTLHQIYNVLICEINPYLFENKKKPDIYNIKTKSLVKGKNVIFKISVPLSNSNQIWQLDRRGGWGHDPSNLKMKNKCNKLAKKNNLCLGPVQNIASGDFGKITEYFITHTI